MTNYLDRANGYITGVLSGAIPACRWVVLACERQRDDLAEPPGGYLFDEDRATRVCRFIERLPHIKGEWAGQPIHLEPWQCFVLTTAFGWVGADGRRRFKTVYIEVPRKNGKSALSSGVALYMLAADGEGGAEVYSAATTRDQARIVWDDAKRMVERSEGLRGLGVGASAHAIHKLNSASTFKALSRDQGGNLDGLNVHCAIVDELHAHKTRDVWDVLETATGARRQPMLWAITTAGFNRAGVCYEVRTYVQKILSGQADDVEFWGCIWGIDDADKWDDPTVWQKANPNWGISVKPDDIARKARKAMEMAAATNNFLTKHLNVWVNADTAWMDMRKWSGCEDDLQTIDEFEGCDCYVGIDLASKIDLAEVSIVFERAGNLHVFNRHYLNEDAVEDGRNSQYQGWAGDGRLTVTPGNVTDYAYIEDDLVELAKRFNIRAVGYDPWQAVYIANRLTDKGLPMVEVRQTVQNMSEPMKYLQAMVYSGKVRHDGDPVLTWMISNVVAHLDAKENIYPRKQSPENKIDGVVALIMALGRYINERNETAEDISDWISSPVIG